MGILQISAQTPCRTVKLQCLSDRPLNGGSESLTSIFLSGARHIRRSKLRQLTKLMRCVDLMVVDHMSPLIGISA